MLVRRRTRSSRLLGSVVLAAVALAWPRVARADVVWPALFVAGRLLTWWIIALGVLIEAAYVYRAFPEMRPGRALWASVAMNGLSTAVGIVLIPVAGLAWEVFPGLVLSSLFDVSTFHPVTWIATLVLAVVVNCLLERLVLQRFFHLVVTRRALAWLAAANAVTVGLAMASLLIRPPRI